MEAIDRFTYDARWRHACGVGGWDASLVEFDRTVLVKYGSTDAAVSLSALLDIVLAPRLAAVR